MADWQKLQHRFLEIVKKADGPMKSSCGSIDVYFGSPYAFDYTGVGVTLGGYCIGDWGRQEKLGPFKTEDEAYEATVEKVNEAERIVGSEGQCSRCHGTGELYEAGWPACCMCPDCDGTGNGR